MKVSKIVGQIDRWGSIAFIYLIPWQARLIFRQGFLAGAPSETLTRSFFALEAAIFALLAVRIVAMLVEKKDAVRCRLYAVRSFGRVLFAFGCLAFVALFSVIVSADQTTTVFAALRLAEGLAVFFLVLSAPSEREARLAFFVSALTQSAIAVAQATFQHVYPNSWLGMAAHYPEMQGTSVVEAPGMRFLRAYGTLPHPNILGGMLAVAILGSRPLWKRASLLSIGAYVLLGVGLFFSFSRLAWLALAVGAAVQWSWARRDRVFAKNIAATLVAMALCAVFMAPFVTSRVASQGRLENKSIAARVSSLKDAWEIIRRYPITGTGAGIFTVAVHERVAPSRSGYDLEPVHSAPLAAWAETGVFGLLLYVWLFGLLFVSAYRCGRIGLASALAVLALFDHWSWTTFVGILIFWAGWGFTSRGTCDNGYTQKAGAIVISRDNPGKILLLYRDGPNYCDWTFPKGHMEPGESRENTAHREIKEETGLDIELLDQLPPRDYVTGNGHPAAAHFFLARSLDDSRLRLEPGHPKNKLEWVDINEVERILSFDNMKEYFRHIKARVILAAVGFKNAAKKAGRRP